MITIKVNFNSEHKLIPSLNPVATSTQFRRTLTERFQREVKKPIHLEEDVNIDYPIRFPETELRDMLSPIYDEVVQLTRIKSCNAMVELSSNGGLFHTEPIPFHPMQGDARRYIVDTSTSRFGRLMYSAKRENLQGRTTTGMGISRTCMEHSISDCIKAYLIDLGEKQEVGDYLRERIAREASELDTVCEELKEAEDALSDYEKDPDNFVSDFDAVLDENYDCDLAKVTGESPSTIIGQLSRTTYRCMLADWFDGFDTSNDEEVQNLQEAVEDLEDTKERLDVGIELLDSVKDWVEDR